MKANKYKGNARKGSRRETITVLKNGGIAHSANEKVTKTIVRDRYVKDKGRKTLASFFYNNYDILTDGKIMRINRD